jgi:protein-S-isoprenylcysteine O-methyltransferase Ste14
MEATDELLEIARAPLSSESLFDWVAACIVIVSMVYLSFALTLRDWFAGLRRGEAVTLLPERPGRHWPLWTQAAVVVVGMVIAIPFIYFLWIPLPGMRGSLATVMAWIGLGLYCLGMITVLAARRRLGKYWGLSTSAQVKLHDDHRLIDTGPYAFVRHPMYFGAFVLFLGLTLLYPVWAMLLLFLFSLISFLGRARREEELLSERFGKQWAQYKKRTKFIIPYIL